MNLNIPATAVILLAMLSGCAPRLTSSDTPQDKERLASITRASYERALLAQATRQTRWAEIQAIGRVLETFGVPPPANRDTGEGGRPGDAFKVAASISSTCHYCLTNITHNRSLANQYMHLSDIEGCLQNTLRGKEDGKPPLAKPLTELQIAEFIQQIGMTMASGQVAAVEANRKLRASHYCGEKSCQELFPSFFEH